MGQIVQFDIPEKTKHLEGVSAFPLSVPDRSSHEKRLSSYGSHKKRARIVAKYIYDLAKSEERAILDKNTGEINKNGALEKLADKVAGCGSYLSFRNYYLDGKYRLVSGFTCDKHLLCGLCAVRRSAKQFYAYKEKYDHIIRNNPDLRLVFFTVTVKNGPDLAERYDHLYNSMRKMLQKRKDAKRGKASTVFEWFKGAVWSYETTNIGNGWHPHLHGLALVHKSADPARLEARFKQEWQKITKDSNQIRVEFPKSEYNQEKAFFEVFKYSLKFTDLSVKNQFHAYETLSKRRLMSSFGAFYGVKLPETEVTPEEEKEFYDILYKYENGVYQKIRLKFDGKDFAKNEEQPIERDQRLKAKNKLDDQKREIEWSHLVENYISNLKLNQSKLNYSIMHQKKIIGFVRSVVGRLKNGGTTFYRLPLRHAVHVGINTEKVKRRNQDDCRGNEEWERIGTRTVDDSRQGRRGLSISVKRRQSLWACSFVNH